MNRATARYSRKRRPDPISQKAHEIDRKRAEKGIKMDGIGRVLNSFKQTGLNFIGLEVGLLIKDMFRFKV